MAGAQRRDPGGMETERAALVAADAQLRLILESPSIILFSLDREYRYTSFNRNHADTMRAIWGVEIAIGRNMLELIGDPADRRKAKRNFDRALAGEEFTLVEAYGDAELKRTYYEDRYCPTRGAGGEIVGVTVFVTDVTERIRAEEERLELEKRMQEAARLESLGVLAGGIAHDFNNLLAGIQGAAELALTDLPRESDLRPLLQIIERSAERAAALTRQLLAYSGKGRFVLETFDLSRAVAEMSELLVSSTEKTSRLVLHLDPDPLPIQADPGQVSQIVMNLVINASDALQGREGIVEVRTSRRTVSLEDLEAFEPACHAAPGEYACVEVVDDGVGMDFAVRSRMFEPFFSTKGTGRGLGLSATLGIVRGHHGILQVRSRPGEGSSILVGFPLVSAEVEGDEDTSRMLSEIALDARVLVVDDEDPVRWVASARLARAGAVVEEAPNGRTALEILRARHHEFDLVLLDLSMPGVSGDQVQREIAALDERLPVVLMSGFGPTESRRRVGEGRRVSFLSKPFRGRDLLEAVRAALADRRSAGA